METESAIEKVNLEEKLKLFADHWSPKIVGDLNESQVKLVKLKGEFVWHHHEAEDELFLVVKGHLLIRDMLASATQNQRLRGVIHLQREIPGQLLALLLLLLLLISIGSRQDQEQEQ